MIFFVMAVIAYILTIVYVLSGLSPKKEYALIYYETFFVLMLGHGLFSVIKLFI